MQSPETEQVCPARFHDAGSLAVHLLGLRRGCPRVMVGIAGIPGSGKSTLASLLCAAIDRLTGRPGSAVVVPQDGFHLTNRELERLGLAARKGSPASFDAASLLKKLCEIERGGSVVRMPIYSRELHEPVPDAVEIKPETPFIIMEGNYLFCDHGAWRAISALFDTRIFVAAAMDVARERVIARHVRGGLSPEAAVAKYVRNDRPNSELVAPTVRVADGLYEGQDPSLGIP